jgi:arylsulfatase A-like enzyme
MRASLVFAVVAMLVACSRPAPRPPATDLTDLPHVVLITLDTVRRDHAAIYGYSRVTTPFLDRWAVQGAVFDRAVASSSTTAPAHAALFTGMYPSQSGVRNNADALDASAATLGAAFTAAGYDTAAIASVGFLRSVTAGFSHIDVPPARDATYRSAEETADAAVRWLSERTQRKPVFLWVHLFDAHEPARALPDDVARFLPASAEERRAFERHARESFAIPATYHPEGDLGADLAELFARYDAQLLRVDRAVASIHAAFSKAGLAGDTLWVVTADHGQGLGSHGLYGHGRHLYDEQLAVPLWVVGPGVAPARVDRVVQHIDLFPSLVQRFGLPVAADAGRRGRAWPELVPGAAALEDEWAYSERRTFPGEAPETDSGDMVAYQDRRWKWIDRAKGPDEAYDRTVDPLEQHNRAGTESADRLREPLEGLRGAWTPKASSGLPADSRGLLDQLEALGYLGGRE